MGKITHTHHIIPRHAGGTDDPDNLVELMPIDHAIAHKVRYGLYGDKEDLWAYGAIMDMYGTGVEVERGGKNNPMYGRKRPEEWRRNHSAFMKGRYVGENNPNYGSGDKISGENNYNWKGGVSFDMKEYTRAWRAKQGMPTNERIHYCAVCGKGPMAGNQLTRWHKKCTGTS